MDSDITVNDEDGQEVPPEYAESMKNIPNFSSSASFVMEVLTFIQHHAWLIVIGIGILVVIYFKFVKPHLDKFKRKWTEQKHQKVYDEDVTLRRQEAMEHARHLMQEKLNAQTEKKDRRAKTKRRNEMC